MKYKINIQESVALLYANDELTARAIKKTIPFTIASKRVKYSGINLTQNINDFNSKLKDIEERN